MKKAIYSEAQKRADENYRYKNREHTNYLRARSAAKSFINKKATLVDIEELEKLIDDRKNMLNSIDLL